MIYVDGMTTGVPEDGSVAFARPSNHGQCLPGAAAEPRRWRERVPWTRRRNAAFAHPHTPFTDRATGLLDPPARNPIRFIEIAIRFRRNRPDIAHPGNGPFLLNRRVPVQKSVIAGGVTSRNTRDRRRPVVSPSRCGRSRRLLHLA